MLAQASGPETARARVDDWAERIASDDRLSGELYRTSVQTYLAGQLMVRAIELEDERGEMGAATLDGSETRASHARDNVGAFLGLPFEEALAFFRSKRLMSPAEFDLLLDRYRSGGFTARRLATERLQEAARSAIERMLAEGLSVDDVVREIRAGERDEVRALGIEPSAPGYIETVVRTNVASAYGYGRQQAMSDPRVQALRPWVQHWTARDSRVREGHAALHGMVFRAGGELASRYAVPLHYNCRCSQVTLSQRQFDARGLEERTERVEELEREGFWPGAAAPIEPLLDGLVATPTRPLTTHRLAFEGLTPDEATDVATGVRPPVSGARKWEPIRISDERLFRGGGIVLTDGNHRLSAAVQAGASEILAIVRVYDERGDVLREELRTVPTDGVAVRPQSGAVGT